MSIISCVLLFLLCLPLHACNARRLSAVDKEHEKKFHFSSKNDEKANLNKISGLSKVKPSLSKELGAANGDSKIEKSTVDEDIQMPKVSEADRKELKDKKGEISSSLQNESLASVSWCVPHKKRGDQQPGFNLDYSPPKTHPPSHN